MRPADRQPQRQQFVMQRGKDGVGPSTSVSIDRIQREPAPNPFIRPRCGVCTQPRRVCRLSSCSCCNGANGTSSHSCCLLFTAFFILSRKFNFLIPLAAGPALATFTYLIMHGITDPAWFTWLALLTNGMLVGSPVTAIRAAVTRKHLNDRR